MCNHLQALLGIGHKNFSLNFCFPDFLIVLEIFFFFFFFFFHFALSKQWPEAFISLIIPLLSYIVNYKLAAE
jgi:hypothetical protein